MDPFGSHIVAESRAQDYAREAANERLASLARRRNHQAEPRSAPAPREAVRPAIA